MAPAQEGSALSLFLVLTKMESGEDALNRIMDAMQLAALEAGKSWLMKYPREQIAVKAERLDCRFHELATGSARSRAVSRSAAEAGSEAELAIGCEPSLFLVGQVRPFVVQQ